MIRRLFILSFLLLLAAGSFAQKDSLRKQKDNTNKDKDEIYTLFGGDKASHGGYGGLSLVFTPDILDRNALLAGASAAWVMNHWFTMGFAGYSMILPIHKDIGWGTTDPKSLEFFMGYGGLQMEIAIAPKLPVHLNLPLLIGAGGAVYYDRLNDYDYDWSWRRDEADAFFVVEPGVGLEFNMLKNLRFGFTLQKRFVDDLYLNYTPQDGLNGTSFMLNMKIGKF